MMYTLQVEMGLGDMVEGIRCALTPEQVSEYDLPRSLDAMKDTDPRTPKYRATLREEGYSDELAVEVDALPPNVLMRLVEQAIEANLDLSQLQADSDAAFNELSGLQELREEMESLIEEILDK